MKDIRDKQTKVLLCANLGTSEITSSGQIIKSIFIRDELIKIFGKSQVSIHNTNNGVWSLIRFIFNIFGYLRDNKNVVIMPAENGVRIIAPLLYYANKIFHKRLFYVVIGGWLPRFLSGRNFLRKVLDRFDGIFVETDMMKALLEQEALKNVYVMPNFKRLDAVFESKTIDSTIKPVKVCTFSRVMKEKGIEDAICAVVELNKEKPECQFELHIYGNVAEEQKDWFRSIEEAFPPFVKYMGSVNYNESVDVLQNYFALLFPTYYEGEGVAGTLIDAMAAGIPSIASDWHYNKEIIKDGINGLIFEVRNINELKEKILILYNNKELYDKIRISSRKEYEYYSPENVMQILISRMQ